jgi:hypothetical protein
MPYVGGFATYDRICADVASRGYDGFRLATIPANAEAAE